MLRYAPYALGILLLAGATYWQAQIVDRWGRSGISTAELQQRFANVPDRIGDWVGTDAEVSDEVKETAGAVAHVNRIYRNEETGEEVALWLIAGHAKDIVRHTPDICYPAQGYRRARNEIRHEMPTQDGSQAVFRTAIFEPESDLKAGTRRVFWAWSIQPSEDEEPQWQAPSSARLTFRNTSSLFKMYFTSLVRMGEATASESPCIDFAQVCIPEVNRALYGELSTSPAAATETTTTASDAGDTDDPAAEGDAA